MIRIIFSIFIGFTSVLAQGQPAERLLSRTEYIEKYKDEAIRGMLESGVPASITLAQGLLESANGNSPLAKYANNHFGIKCHGWKGGTFIQDDDAKDECFRKYPNVYASYKDHAEFLSTRSRYAFLFQLSQTDYKAWARGLKKAGYATNPKYADLLIRLIEDNDLNQYDQVNKMPRLAKKMSDKKPELIASRPKKIDKRFVGIHENNIRYTKAEKGDSFYRIAEEFEMGLWQIYKYNDLTKGDKLHENDIIYLQPKRGKAKVKEHVVKKGETVRDISQQYGVKIKKIIKYNQLTSTTNIIPGQRLVLR